VTCAHFKVNQKRSNSSDTHTQAGLFYARLFTTIQWKKLKLINETDFHSEISHAASSYCRLCGAYCNIMLREEEKN
jgi:hypothetical protein